MVTSPPPVETDASAISDNVAQNVAHRGGCPENQDHRRGVIACVEVAGGIVAQGYTLDPPDPRGFVKTDMHGRLAIDIGGKIIVGRPIPSVRRGRP